MRRHFTWGRYFTPADLVGAHTWRDRQDAEGEHDHDFHEIVLITGGSGVHHLAAGDVALARGSFAVMQPGSWHAYRDGRGLCGLDCCFTLEGVRRFMPGLLDNAAMMALLAAANGAAARHGVVSGRLGRESIPGCLEAFRQLAALNDRLEPELRIERLGRFLIAMARLAHAAAAELGAAERYRPPHPSTVTTARMIDADLARAWTVPELAAAAALDPSALTRHFRRTYGVAPLAYLNQRRAERAAYLLVASSEPVGVVGAEVGWFDPNYFARRFRSALGMTPSSYRFRFREREEGPPTPVATRARPAFRSPQDLPRLRR